MRIHILSDIHIEHRKPAPRPKGGVRPAPTYVPSVTDADVVVLAGDIHTQGRGVAWAKQAFPNSQVLYVPGNHEYWRGNVDLTTQKMKAEASGSHRPGVTA